MDYLQQYSILQQQRHLLEAHHTLQASAAATPPELSLGVNGKHRIMHFHSFVLNFYRISLNQTITIGFDIQNT